MKILLLFFILFLSFSAFGQTSEKELKKQQKEQKKAAERELKERLKRPAFIVVNAPVDLVNKVLVYALQLWEYQIDEESPRRIVMSKPVKGFGDKLLANMTVGNGVESRYSVQANLTELGTNTSVTLSFSLGSKNVFGKTNSMNLDSNKKLRPQVDDLLQAVKTKSESEYVKIQAKKAEEETNKKTETQKIDATAKVFVEITSEPSGAEIFVNDVFVGSTPSKIPLTQGENKISVVRTGFNKWERTVKTEIGSSLTLNAILEKTSQ